MRLILRTLFHSFLFSCHILIQSCDITTSLMPDYFFQLHLTLSILHYPLLFASVCMYMAWEYVSFFPLEARSRWIEFCQWLQTPCPSTNAAGSLIARIKSWARHTLNIVNILYFTASLMATSLRCLYLYFLRSNFSGHSLFLNHTALSHHDFWNGFKVFKLQLKLLCDASWSNCQCSSPYDWHSGDWFFLV